MKKIVDTLQIAAVYIGTVIGAGFATGKEIVEFFTQFGSIGLMGIVLSGICFIYFGTTIMLMTIDLRIESVVEFNQFLYGQRFGKPITLFMMIILLSISAVMMAGAEALFYEQLQFPKGLGSFITAILLCLFLLRGVKGLFVVNLVIVPMIIIFTLLIFLQTVDSPFIMMASQIGFENGEIGRVILSGFSYAALNLTLAQAVLIPIAHEINNRISVKLGGILGGSLLTLLLFCIHHNLIHIENVEIFEIPMAIVVKEFSHYLLLIYIFIVFGEIFTSLLANMYGIERYMMNRFDINRIYLFLIILSLIFSISLINYSVLLSFLYPLFGYLSIGSLFLLFIRRKKKTTFD